MPTASRSSMAAKAGLALSTLPARLSRQIPTGEASKTCRSCSMARRRVTWAPSAVVSGTSTASSRGSFLGVCPPASSITPSTRPSLRMGNAWAKSTPRGGRASAGRASAWYLSLQAIVGLIQFASALAMLAGYRRVGVWGDF